MSRDLNTFPKVLKIGAAAIAGTLSLGGLYFFNGQKESFHNNFVLPILHKLDPELSHKIAILALSHCYLAPNFNEDHHMLRTHIKTLNLNNPIGLAAGFDKDGKAVPNLEKIGFGFVEVGSITPKPQPGNPPLRLFRLPEDKAIINRYGFNSVGHDKALRFLKVNKNNHYSEGVVGINLGVNKDSKDPIMDYVQGIRKFTDVADYYVINISSPNTPGLRNLQQKQQLESVLLKVLEARDTVKKKIKPLIFLKLSPDLTSEERHDIASIILQPQYRVDGLIISNTTIQRDPTLKNSLKKESGGLSGLPLKQRSTEMIAEMYKLTKGSIPIIGVGGIFTGADAFEKIKAGASAVQIYTSFVYHGIPIVEKIKQELVECLKNEKYKYVYEAVGKGVDLES